MGVSPFRNREVCDQGVKRRIHLAVIEVVARVLHGRFTRASLVNQRLECSDRVMRLLVLRLALFKGSPRPLVLRLRGLEACLRKPQLRTRLLQRFRLRDLRRFCTIHLIDGDELLCQKRLKTVQVVAGVRPLCFCPAYSLLRIGHIRPRLLDGRRASRSEEHTSELQSRSDIVCRLLLEKKKNKNKNRHNQKKKKIK